MSSVMRDPFPLRCGCGEWPLAQENSRQVFAGKEHTRWACYPVLPAGPRRPETPAVVVRMLDLPVRPVGQLEGELRKVVGDRGPILGPELRRRRIL